MSMNDGRRKRRAGFALLCLAALALAFACRKKEVRETAPSGLPLDDSAGQTLMVLEIGDRGYTNADFLKYLRATVGEAWRSLGEEGASRLFDDFADRKVLVQQAREEGIALTEAERSGYLQRLRTAMGDDGIREVQAAPDPDSLEEALLAEKYLSLRIEVEAVSEADIAGHYALHKADYLEPERLQVSQILVADEGKASVILDRLKDAGEDAFRQAAQTESMGPEAAKGGIMGVFNPGQLPPELEKVIFVLKVGETSPVVESSYGYHIFRVDRKTDFRLVPLEEAAPLIRAALLEERGKEAVAAHLAEIKAAPGFVLHPENLPFAYQRIRP
jgi:parvulin-like peptidyl-prolyl isomerase